MKHWIVIFIVVAGAHGGHLNASNFYFGHITGDKR